MTDIARDTSPASMAHANEANLFGGFAACALAYGGEVRDDPDLLWCATGLPAAGWNRVLRARLAPETLDARIAEVIARARTLGVPFQWDLSPSTRPADLAAHLVRHGFTDGGSEPAMGVALANLPAAPSLPDGVTIARVKDPAAMEDWVRTVLVSFGAPTSAVPVFLPRIARDLTGDPPAAHYYLARLHGEPVAGSALTTAGGVAGIFSVATVESARRRGIGAAITMAPLLDARARGYHVGVLQASEMGYPIYARMGFTEQFRYHSFAWRPA